MFDIDEQDRIAVLRFNHGKVNAMDIEFCDAVIEALKRLSQSATCAAVILTGNERVFSAGIDLKRFLQESPDYVNPFLAKLESLFESVFSFPKPLISEINGAAIAGGCMVAAGADYRVISPTAKIGILESRLGVPLPMLAIEIMRHVASPSAFREITSIGATYLGEHAVRCGLADNCAKDTQSEAWAAAKRLTEIPLAAFQVTKRQRTDPVIKIAQANRESLGKRYHEIWNCPTTRSTIQRYVADRL